VSDHNGLVGIKAAGDFSKKFRNTEEHQQEKDRYHALGPNTEVKIARKLWEAGELDGRGGETRCTWGRPKHFLRATTLIGRYE